MAHRPSSERLRIRVGAMSHPPPANSRWFALGVRIAKNPHGRAHGPIPSTTSEQAARLPKWIKYERRHCIPFAKIERIGRPTPTLPP